MSLKQITNRILYLPNSEETDRPTIGYVNGDHFSVIIDVGNSPKHVNIIENEILKHGLPLPKLAAITHWHWDHTYGMCAFKGQVIANKLTNQQLIKMRHWQWTDQDMKERLRTGEDIEFCDRHIRIEYPDLNEIKVCPADIIFENTLTLDLGNVTCELRLVGGPHSDDSTIVYIPEEKVLFVGDADSGDFYFNHGKYDKKKLEYFLNKIKEIPFETYVHGHCEPMTREIILKELEEELRNL